MGRSKCITAELMARSWLVMQRSDWWTDGLRYYAVCDQIAILWPINCASPDRQEAHKEKINHDEQKAFQLEYYLHDRSLTPFITFLLLLL